jgi:hypothetical protein
MAFVTRYGTLLGMAPHVIGKTFWVAPSASYSIDGNTYEASDNNDGLAPDRALRRVNRAWALCSALDTIILLPGDHLAANMAGTATSIAANVANVTMTGLTGIKGNPFYKRTTLSVAAADQTVNVTAAGVEIANIKFVGNVLNVGSAHVDYSSAAHGFYFHDNTVDMTAQTANTGIIGVDALGAAQYVVIQDNVFYVDGAFGAMIDMTATLDSLVSRNKIVVSAGVLAAGITAGAATDRLEIEGNVFNDGAGTITAGIDGTGATIANGVAIYGNRFGVTVTVPIDNFDAAEAQISDNFDFGVGATDGGVLVVAIT